MMTESSNTQCDYLLLTALDEEADALHEALKIVGASGPNRIRFPQAPTGLRWKLPHKLGRLDVVTATLLDMGLDSARDWTQRLLNRLQPKYVGFLGIAGGAADGTDFGAVLVASHVWYYHPAKVKEEGIDYRSRPQASGRICLDRLKHIDLALLDEIFPDSRPWAKPLVGTIASGEEVVASAERRDALRKAGKEVIGFEMEGHSFADEAEKTLGRDRWFMVRAVQDKADKEKSDQHRKLACRRAAQFVVGFLLDSDLCIPEGGDEEVKRNIPLKPSTGPVEHDDALFTLASALAIAKPESFLKCLDMVPHRAQDGRWAALEAEAYWGLKRVDDCLQAALRVTAIEGTGSFSEHEATAIRLRAWAHGKRGEQDVAAAILKGQMHRVVSQAERGRWATLLASTTRFKHDPDNEDVVVGWYLQALALKEASGDPLGYAITLHSIASTYLERLDFEAARRYYRRLIRFTETANYPDKRVGGCRGLLGLTWIDLIQWKPLNYGIARQRLKEVGQELGGATDSVVANEMRMASKAMHFLLGVRAGTARQHPPKTEGAFWASLIIAQARSLRAEDVGDLIRELSVQPASGFAPHAIPGLIAACKAAPSPLQSPIELQVKYGHCFWPLGVWVRSLTVEPWESVRFLEGVAHLYAAILRGISGETFVDTKLTLGQTSRSLVEWASRNSSHQLTKEVQAVAALLIHATPVRNTVIHSSPGQKLAPQCAALSDAVARVLDEMTLLRDGNWRESIEATLGVANEEVKTAPFIIRSQETGKFAVLGSDGQYQWET